MKILMVCLGNICRSPMAEGILRKKLTEAGIHGWTVDSAGTNQWHKGGPADARAVAACLKRGVDIRSHIARRVRPKDFDNYDILFSMADDVTEELGEFIREPSKDAKKIRFFLDAIEGGPRSQSVPDPWYGESDGFDECFTLIERACDHIVAKAKK